MFSPFKNIVVTYFCGESRRDARAPNHVDGTAGSEQSSFTFSYYIYARLYRQAGLCIGFLIAANFDTCIMHMLKVRRTV